MKKNVFSRKYLALEEELEVKSIKSKMRRFYKKSKCNI